jgi:hypothetical protein
MLARPPVLRLQLHAAGLTAHDCGCGLTKTLRDGCKPCMSSRAVLQRPFCSSTNMCKLLRLTVTGGMFQEEKLFFPEIV